MDTKPMCQERERRGIATPIRQPITRVKTICHSENYSENIQKMNMKVWEDEEKIDG